MNRLPRLNGRQVLQALRHGGFDLSHVRGSHHYLRRHDGTGLVVVPVQGNRTLPAGTLNSVLRQAGLTIEELHRLWRE